MNSMNDQHFFDLAMKAIRHQGTDAERAELNAALERQPELRVEFERLQSNDQLVKAVLPLTEAMDANRQKPTQPEPAVSEGMQHCYSRRPPKTMLPGYARGRLQAKVRERFGVPNGVNERRPLWARWGWISIAVGVAVLTLMLSLRVEQPHALEIQVAMLDLAGTTRGSNTNELAILQQLQPDSEIRTFASESELAHWEGDLTQDSERNLIKVVYDRSSDELRVLGYAGGRMIQATFPVEGNLRSAVEKAAALLHSKP